MRLPAAVEDFQRACQIGSLAHLDMEQQREALRLLVNLNFLRFGQPGPPLTVTDHHIPSPAGRLPIRLYRPEGDGGHAPGVHLFLHGGGWWQGSIDDLVNDATCRQVAAATGVVVATVEYRLAPEHRFPAALDDCRAALRWLLAEGSGLGLNPASISVGGNSAGANLAAGLALSCREDGLPLPILQVLEVPVLDLTLDTARMSLSPATPSSELADLELAVAHYMGPDGRASTPPASPLQVSDLHGLPPTLIVVAEHDPLRADGLRYGERLRDADVPVRTVEIQGALHGAALLTRTWEPARAWQQNVVSALTQAHRSTPVPLRVNA